MLKFNVDKAYGNIDVVLKQRADEIPNLVTVAKHFMNYEEKLLYPPYRAQNFYNNSTDANKRTEIANETSKRFLHSLRFQKTIGTEI